MKKVLLTLVMTLVFGGTIFAQWYDNTEYYNPNGYETYFDQAYAFNPGNYMYTDYPIAYLQCNGNLVSLEDNWADYEVASFVNGELRGFCFLTSEYYDWGYLFPFFDGIFVYNVGDGEVVTFKVYDHSTGMEYDCTTNMDVITGQDYSGVYDDPDGTSGEALIISFTRSDEPQTFTKEITGYSESTDHYYLIASPVGTVSPENVENMLYGSYDLYYYQTSTYYWMNYKDETFDLEPGQGYLYANSEDVTLTFTGTPIDADEYVEGYAVPLTYGVDHYEGWNLVGNPFGIDAYTDERPFYVLNEAGDEYVAMEPDSVIRPMEGVFVIAESASDDEMMFYPDVEAGGGGFDPPTKNKNITLSLTQGRGLVDRAVVRIGEGRTLPKFQLNPSHTKVYVPQDGEDYAIVNAGEMGELPVNFKAESDGTYGLSVSAKNVGFNYLHLVDNMTGADVDLLANPSYTFEAQSTDYATRFKLVFATGDNSDNSFAFFSNGNFIVSNEGEATLQVVDVMGRILKSESINGSASVNVNAAPGVYMLRLVNGDNMKVQKVVVE